MEFIKCDEEEQQIKKELETNLNYGIAHNETEY